MGPVARTLDRSLRPGELEAVDEIALAASRRWGGLVLEDRNGNRYVEFPMSETESVRLTIVKHADWAGGPTLRVQKRTPTGRLAQGPEFPASLAPVFAKSLVELVQS